MRIYKIYKLLFPGGEVYIGKTHLELMIRFGKDGYKYESCSSAKAAIEKYGWENVEKIILYENLTKEEASRLEVIEITKHGGINHPLVLNDQSGGDFGYTVSNAVKEKLSKARKEYIQNHPGAIDKLSKASLDARKNNPESWKDFYVPVDQYSYDYKTLLHSYSNINEAHKMTRVNRWNIHSYIKGLAISAGGYRWIKHGKHFGIMQYRSGYTPVNQIDIKTGKIIATYESIAEASKSANINASSISNCINGKCKIAGGYMWEKLYN